MARSEASLASLLLTQRIVDGDAPPLKALEYWALAESAPDLADLLGRSAAQIATTWQLGTELAERIEARLAMATQVAIVLDEQEQSGLQIVTPIDELYPLVLHGRLRTNAPPVLYAVGDLTLAGAGGLGVVGSREVSPAGAEIALAAATDAAKRAEGVISGGAKGVDRLAIGAALEAGGTAVGILADSLARTVRDSELRRLVTDGRLCLLTPYKPTAGFSVGAAMGRNKLIYALSTATFVVAADLESGGTWAGAIEALDSQIAPVLVWSGPGGGEGNGALAERGANAVDAVGSLFPLDQWDQPLPDARGGRSRTTTTQLALDL